MMKEEDNVCSLELAKHLEALGVKQESIFVWEYYDDQCHAVKYIPYAVVPNEFNKFQLYSAFTVAELGKMLPHKIEHEESDVIFGSIKTLNNEWQATYYHEEGESLLKFVDVKEADARAKMLIYLLEKKLMELPNE